MIIGQTALTGTLNLVIRLLAAVGPPSGLKGCFRGCNNAVVGIITKCRQNDDIVIVTIIVVAIATDKPSSRHKSSLLIGIISSSITTITALNVDCP